MPSLLSRHRLAVLGAIAVGVLAPPAAAVGLPSAVEVHGVHGNLVAARRAGPFSYPRATGSAVRIGNATATADGVDLQDVSLLGGLVWAFRVYVPVKQTDGARIESLVIAGHRVAARPNQVIHLSARTYLMLQQSAYVPGRNGRTSGSVGMRLYVGDTGLGVPRGTQILVGLSRPTLRKRERGRSGNAAMLGIDPAAVEKNPPLPIASPLSLQHGSLGSRAVAIAEQYLGVPYVWAGADPSGFDCSGLTMYVYGQLNVSLPHSSSMQFNMGTPVPRDLLSPGDLVFFGENWVGDAPKGRSPGHVGIYIGDGKFIHAPHTGDVVKISSLSDLAYAFQFRGAVRPY